MFRTPTFGGLLAGLFLAASQVTVSAQPLPRTSSTQKGSVLIFSDVEIMWSADGQALLQDTVLDITNDYPADVDVQAFYINGDIELDEICAGFPCAENIIQEFEPGWNTADCRFTLTANQPHFWSAATGSDKCQPFTVLDSNGPGRPDPDTGMTTRVLRGYVIFFAVDFIEGAAPDGRGRWGEIRWNHLKGDAVVINYEDGTAWEYNAWAFQTEAVPHGDPTGDMGELHLDGVEFETAFGNLVFDFFASGATALSGGREGVQVDTALTMHAVSADLRQDGCGPVLTKVEAEAWNEFESKFSGTRRCVCCWDRTMISEWVRSAAIPNHFTRSMLRTDRGKARLDGVESFECDYETLCGSTAVQKRSMCDNADVAGGLFFDSEDAAILGLAVKFLAFEPSGHFATAGLNLVGAGEETAVIRYDVQEGPEELYDGSTRTSGKVSGESSDAGRAPRRNYDTDVRDVRDIPAE